MGRAGKEREDTLWNQVSDMKGKWAFTVRRKKRGKGVKLQVSRFRARGKKGERLTLWSQVTL